MNDGSGGCRHLEEEDVCEKASTRERGCEWRVEGDMHLVGIIKGGVSEGLFQDAMRDLLGEGIRGIKSSENDGPFPQEDDIGG